MAKLGIPAALVVISALSLGGPAGAAPLTSLSAAANPTMQQSDIVQARYGGWHGGWHGGGGFPAAAFAGALIGGAMAAAPYAAAPYYDDGYHPYYGDYGYAAVPYRDPAPYYGTRPGYYRGCYPHCGWGG